MSAGSALAAFVAVAAAVVAVFYYLAALRVRRSLTDPAGAGAAGTLLRELTEELQASRAEARHWRRTAERLQAELDRRGGEPPG